MHPSYETYRRPEQIRREFERLQAAAHALGVQQPRWGGRQHYLRWENPITWQAWDDAGLDYDSTLSFADHAGFRCGMCYEYPVFNLQTRQTLRVRERPLIVMEGTLFDYMGLSYDDALALLCLLGRRCRQFGGEFVLLWHNSYLLARWHREFYSHALQALAGNAV
ncbi:MAG: polysaccharide deacetylase family protein [Fimbriimonadales bacterium]|nr:polysaccharide deacetylase family protein [Fimbriimonadales bacterium]